MAQWVGQFSGNTHLSKLQERERQLRHAIEVLTKQSPPEQKAQMKAIVRLAVQVHNARLRAVNARIALLDPRDIQEKETSQVRIDRLIADGISAVLLEFGADIVADISIGDV